MSPSPHIRTTLPDEPVETSQGTNAGDYYTPLSVTMNQADNVGPDIIFPPFMTAEEMNTASVEKPPVLIDGILHRGSKMVLGGGSKSYKTFTLVDLGLCVASGGEWLGRQCQKSNVLFINFEIQTPFFGDRIKQVMFAKGITSAPGLNVWNLRGVSYDLKQIIPELTRRVMDRNYGLIVIDPLYKCLGKLDENKAGDMAEMLNTVEQIALQTGAAVVFGSHFAKGNAAGKEAIDRISGSGVFARDPDAILTVTPHEDSACFTVDAILRNFPPVDPFVVEWCYPLMRPCHDKDPSKLKRKAGRTKQHTQDDLLAKLAPTGMRSGEWEDVSGMSHGIFDGLRKGLLLAERVKCERGVYTLVS